MASAPEGPRPEEEIYAVDLADMAWDSWGTKPFSQVLDVLARAAVAGGAAGCLGRNQTGMLWVLGCGLECYTVSARFCGVFGLGSSNLNV